MSVPARARPPDDRRHEKGLEDELPDEGRRRAGAGCHDQTDPQANVDRAMKEINAMPPTFAARRMVPMPTAIVQKATGLTIIPIRLTDPVPSGLRGSSCASQALHATLEPATCGRIPGVAGYRREAATQEETT